MVLVMEGLMVSKYSRAGGEVGDKDPGPAKPRWKIHEARAGVSTMAQDDSLARPDYDAKPGS